MSWSLGYGFGVIEGDSAKPNLMSNSFSMKRTHWGVPSEPYKTTLLVYSLCFLGLYPVSCVQRYLAMYKMALVVLVYMCGVVAALFKVPVLSSL